MCGPRDAGRARAAGICRRAAHGEGWGAMTVLVPVQWHEQLNDGRTRSDHEAVAMDRRHEVSYYWHNKIRKLLDSYDEW